MPQPPLRKPSLISKSEVRRRAREATGGAGLAQGFEDAVIEKTVAAFEEILREAVDAWEHEEYCRRLQRLEPRKPRLKRRHVKTKIATPPFASWENHDTSTPIHRELDTEAGYT